jgi:hypothetical protein
VLIYGGGCGCGCGCAGVTVNQASSVVTGLSTSIQPCPLGGRVILLLVDRTHFSALMIVVVSPSEKEERMGGLIILEYHVMFGRRELVRRVP